jgi:hypothetical protein
MHERMRYVRSPRCCFAGTDPPAGSEWTLSCRCSTAPRSSPSSRRRRRRSPGGLVSLCIYIF